MVETPDDLVSMVLEAFTRLEQVQIREALDELLNGSISDDDLFALWNASPAEIYFKKSGDLRAILELTRQKLG
jgi:hypothetical protein